jgi:TRAP transporter TAXI family solute receptor
MIIEHNSSVLQRDGDENSWGLGGISAILIALLPFGAAVMADEAASSCSIMIGTASPGGPYYVYGQEIARVLSRVLGIEANAQVTQGPVQNIVLLEKREAMLGYITTGVGLQAWNGADWAKGTKYRSMRVIFPMYDTAFQFAVPKRLAIKSLTDFAGLRIGVGPRAGTGGTYVPEIFKILEIPAIVRFGSIAQQVGQIANGELDGIAFGTGFPIPALSDLTGAQAMEFVQPSAEDVVMIRKQMPEISPSLVPAGTYPSQVRDYQTIGLYNFAVAHQDVPDDLIYKIVKAVFENREELIKAQSLASETIPANIGRNTFLPLHPGAIRYYREVGVAIPPGALADR